MTKPKIAITMGDVSGVGPEIIAAAWSEISQLCEPVVLGHQVIIDRARELRHVTEPITAVNCMDDDIINAERCRVDSHSGHGAFQALVLGIEMARRGNIAALVTAPLNKESLHLAGHHYPGHTEILAERCGVTRFSMMLYLAAGENIASANGLAVNHVTLHTSMREAIEQITVDSVFEKSLLIHEFMQSLNVPRPRIGVCSLNPHAGEGGLFGREEIEIIVPAIERARAVGLTIEGALPADTIMVHAKNGRYDAVVAMFHDQGHIALKLLGMHRAVNITLGLPIIRTSVAHGTAFDKAWQGIADYRSLVAAVKVAVEMSQQRKK
jgi:4-hydroxythreonine-4-phosphate dehydrogenase